MTTEQTPLTMPMQGMQCMQGMQGKASRSLMDVALFGIVAGGLLALHFNQTRIEQRLDTLERSLTPKRRNIRKINEQRDEYDENYSEDDGGNDHEKYDSPVQVHEQGVEEVQDGPEEVQEEIREDEEEDEEEEPPPQPRATRNKK
jgi:hypothetical protein